MPHDTTLAVHRQSARARLAELREIKPRSTAAQVRALWPDIKTALEKGHSLKTVCDCLEADGITISVQSLGSYITRIRRKAVPVETLASPPLPGSAASSNAEPNARPTAQTTRRTGKEPSDPLANVRERLGKRLGFDYRPELADSKDLI